LKRD